MKPQHILAIASCSALLLGAGCFGGTTSAPKPQAAAPAAVQPTAQQPSGQAPPLLANPPSGTQVAPPSAPSKGTPAEQAPPVGAVGTNPTAANPTQTSVEISNFSFQPSSIVIQAGTVVEWTNNDTTAHTVTTDDGKIDSGRILVGGKYTHLFTTPGTYAYHCSVHPTMKGTIVVQ
jgi:plastocyanin